MILRTKYTMLCFVQFLFVPMVRIKRPFTAVIRQLKNNLDWLKLKEAFGNRRIEYTTRSAGLVQNLNADLSSSQLNEINNILSQQGISYRV